MNVTGFLDEAVGATTESSRWIGRTLDIRTNFAALASVFLGLRLRGTLCDPDKEQLDCLAPPGWIAFLADSDGYLHPQGLELFPLDSIMGALKLGSGAVFSHRFCPEVGDIERAYRIHTVLVNPDDPRPMVIGFAGPEDDSDQGRLENRFFELAQGVREAYSDAESIYARLEQNFESNDSCIVINRGSGRIVALNKAACASLGNQANHMIGCEVSAVRGILDKAVSTERIQLQAFNRELLNIVTWTWSKRVVKAPAPSKAGTLESLLIEEMASLRSTPGPEVVKQMDRLVRILHTVEILADFHERPSVPVALADCATEAMNQVRGKCGSPKMIQISGSFTDALVNSAEGTMSAIFESILRSHLSGRDDKLDCEFTSTPFSKIGECTLFIRSSVANAARDGFDNTWCYLAERLAQRMNMGLRWRQDSENNHLITELTFTL